jgi:hypothetical protein
VVRDRLNGGTLELNDRDLGARYFDITGIESASDPRRHRVLATIKDVPDSSVTSCRFSVTAIPPRLRGRARIRAVKLFHSSLALLLEDSVDERVQYFSLVIGLSSRVIFQRIDR